MTFLPLKMMIMMTTKTEITIQPNWPAPACIKAYTTLRASEIGYMQIPERSPGNIDRALLSKTLQLPNEPIWLNQTHSTTAVPAILANDGRNADAVFTDETNRVCAVLTADCLPLLICNKQGTRVAAIHAGWRGLANGVIESTIEALNLPPEDILVWLGPAIGPSKFEVRQDVYDAFTQKDPHAAMAFCKISDEQWLGDLYTLARLRLQKFQITQIYGGEYCTHSDQDRFFSYRRDGKIIGSIVNLIWIADSITKL
jgi:YfiH family protein